MLLVEEEGFFDWGGEVGGVRERGRGEFGLRDRGEEGDAAAVGEGAQGDLKTRGGHCLNKVIIMM